MMPVEMLDDLKDHLDALDNFWTSENLWRRLHVAQQELTRVITRESPTFFVQNTTLTLESDTALYDLPKNARLGTRIIFAEDTTDDLSAEVVPTRLRNLMAASSSSMLNLHSQYNFAFQGDQVRVVPVPAGASTIRVWYAPTFGNMLQGSVTAATSTTLTIWSGAPNWTTNYGIPDVRDDVYSGMKILITEGTGAGQEREVTDWAGASTRRFTTAAWTVTPDTTSKFALMCPIMEDHHGVVTLLAAMHASVKGRTRMGELRQIYHGSPGMPGVLDEMLTWIQKRQDARGQTVEPTSVGDG